MSDSKEEIMEEIMEAVDEESLAPTITLNQIAQPLADDKLSKRLYKLIKKSSAKKSKLHRGLKNVQTKIRKGFCPDQKTIALCVFAGDVTPVDIYCHLPIVCEDKNIPYCFVPSKRDIADALGAKRPCIVALITPDDDYKELFDKCYSKVSSMSC